MTIMGIVIPSQVEKKSLIKMLKKSKEKKVSMLSKDFFLNQEQILIAEKGISGEQTKMSTHQMLQIH